MEIDRNNKLKIKVEKKEKKTQKIVIVIHLKSASTGHLVVVITVAPPLSNFKQI